MPLTPRHTPKQRHTRTQGKFPGLLDALEAAKNATKNATKYATKGAAVTGYSLQQTGLEDVFLALGTGRDAVDEVCTQLFSLSCCPCGVVDVATRSSQLVGLSRTFHLSTPPRPVIARGVLRASCERPGWNY